MTAEEDTSSLLFWSHHFCNRSNRCIYVTFVTARNQHWLHCYAGTSIE